MSADGAEFVVASELIVEPCGAETLEEAFENRLREVEAWAGYRRLEVWRDVSRPGVFVMVSWWESREAFVSYMRSDAHRRSHERIPSEPARPRAVGLRRFDVVAR